MQEISNLLKHTGTWTIHVQLLILYVASTVLFFALQWFQQRATSPVLKKIQTGSIPSLLPVFVLSTGATFVGVVGIVILSKLLSVVAPIAVIGFPLFLLLETHVKTMMANKDQTRFQLTAAAGVLVGMGSGVWLLLRHHPIV